MLRYAQEEAPARGLETRAGTMRVIAEAYEQAEKAAP